MSRALGWVLYEGPSLLDGTPIVVVATANGRNRKVGDAIQTWIMPRDIAPHDARKCGADAAVCGDCRYRDGGCYVLTWQAPRSVWAAYHRGVYRRPKPKQVAGLLAGRFIRLGSWGDPAAAPRWVWLAATRHARGHSGYTQQWRDGFALADLCMASTASDDDDAAARAMGYRTFRVVPPGTPRAPDTIVCPASAERGHALQCHACKACDGTASGRRGHVQIAAHGSAHTRARALVVLQGAA